MLPQSCHSFAESYPSFSYMTVGKDQNPIAAMAQFSTQFFFLQGELHFHSQAGIGAAPSIFLWNIQQLNHCWFWKKWVCEQAMLLNQLFFFLAGCSIRPLSNFFKLGFYWKKIYMFFLICISSLLLLSLIKSQFNRLPGRGDNLLQ